MWFTLEDSPLGISGLQSAAERQPQKNRESEYSYNNNNKNNDSNSKFINLDILECLWKTNP